MTSPELALAAIVQSSQDAIIGHSLDGTITSWNPAAERMYRCSADDVMGHPASRLVPPELHDVERRLIERVARGAVVTTVDTTRVRVDGSRLLVSLSLFPILDEAGKALALVAIERDITHLRAVEAQLQQAKRIESVGRLAGGVAQEFNNINTAILGLVEFVGAVLPPGKTGREDLDEITNQAMRGARLARHLLSFSGRQVLSAHAVSVDDSLRSMQPLLERLVGERAWLTLDLTHEDAHIHADESQLELVIFELVINAAEAIGDRGSIAIATRKRLIDDAAIPAPTGVPSGVYVEISVRHSGTGMSDASRALAFDPLYTTKSQDGHLGFGVAMACGVVQQLGGFISTTSVDPAGTEICIFLPVVRTGSPATPVPSTSAAAGGNETILVVEDEDAVRAVVTRGLRALGYRILEANHGEDALDIAAAYGAPIHMVVSDVVMPQMDGRELFDRLRTWYPNIRFLFISGYTRGAITGEELQGAATRFLAKPFSIDQLATEVRSLFDLPRDTA
jgi:two-component system cell cycle sensor histidine kinase/response regulator CckA